MGSVTQPLSQVLNICYVADTLIYIHEDDEMIMDTVEGPHMRLGLTKFSFTSMPCSL